MIALWGERDMNLLTPNFGVTTSSLAVPTSPPPPFLAFYPSFNFVFHFPTFPNFVHLHFQTKHS